MTQRALADKCGCTVPSISHIEQGKCYPREARMLLAISAVMGILPGELLTRIERDRAGRTKAGTRR